MVTQDKRATVTKDKDIDAGTLDVADRGQLANHFWRQGLSCKCLLMHDGCDTLNHNRVCASDLMELPPAGAARSLACAFGDASVGPSDRSCAQREADAAGGQLVASRLDRGPDGTRGL